MLKKFTVENFKNFKNELVFDLANSKKFLFNEECVKGSISNKSIIYGPNGSGKSNLGFAIFDIVSHLTDKNKGTDLYNNYLYAGGIGNSYATFTYTFEFDSIDIFYTYGKKSQNELVFEQLFINNKPVISYNSRISTQAEFNIKGAENLNPDLKGSKISAIKYLMSNSVLEENEDNKLLIKLIDFVERMLYFRSLGQNNYIGYDLGSTILDRFIVDDNHLDDFEKFLNESGITCKLTTKEVNGQNELMVDIEGKTLRFFDIASTGTRSLSLYYFWLQSLRQNNEVSFLFIDEFDAYYHHTLSRKLVKELKDITSQVVLTTHNVSIMNNDLLRPDCYYILENAKIAPLHEILKDRELRKAHNLEKMYKAGVFSE